MTRPPRRVAVTGIYWAPCATVDRVAAPVLRPPARHPAEFEQIWAGILLGSMLTNWWYPNDPT